MRFCVGDLAVPLEPSVVEVDGGEAQELRVQEIDLSSRLGSFGWIEGALGLKARQFRSASWPLLAEILELLASRRSSLARWAAKQPRVVVSLLVRGRQILVRNNVKAVRICFAEGDVAEGLEWLIAELEKDFVDLDDSLKLAPPRREPRAAPGPSRAGSPAEGASGGDAEAAEAQVRREILAKISRHPACTSATFSASRCALLVHGAWPDIAGEAGGAPRSKRYFGVPALKRRRLEFSENLSDAARALLETAYRAAGQAALDALGPSAAGDDDAGDAARSGSSEGSCG